MRDTRTRLLACIESSKSANAQKLTVSALAKSVGISRSSIYKYYPDVIALLSGGKPDAMLSRTFKDSSKVDLMREQLSRSRELVLYLTNICSNQLIEISKLKEELDLLSSSSTAKILYLESKLSKLEKHSLRAVK